MRTYEKGYWITNDTRTFVSRGYFDCSVEERVKQIAETAGRYVGDKWPGYAEKLKDYIMRGWISLASPIWSNYGADKGLPISCNGSYFEDSIKSIITRSGEIGWMTKMGAGTSAYLGDIRPAGSSVSTGGIADGPVHYAELVQAHVSLISQGATRRGTYAIYLDITHPDVDKWLDIQTEGHPLTNKTNFAVCVPDSFMLAVKASEPQASKIWRKVLRRRAECGEPYIFFSDTANRNAAPAYKDRYRIYASNVCTEIMQPSSKDWSFVCCLLSLNLLHWDEWRDSDLPQVAAVLLDAVTQEYIDKTEGDELLFRARDFAIANRSIGVGVLGWHSYLQSKMIPFESLEAKKLNVEIHSTINARTHEASEMMAEWWGAAPVCAEIGLKQRNATRMAIAPTTSSSFILGQVSSGIEPIDSNYYTKDLAKGKFGFKNKYLAEVLAAHGRDDESTWDSILVRGGSVQHLDFLSQLERDVFKTWGEIDQTVIVEQAAHRQRFIDQAQSLNVKIHPKTPLKDVNALYFKAWEMDVKSLYYQRSTNAAQEFARDLLSCAACEA